MSSTESDFAALLSELKRLDRLASIGGILSWDEQVNLPKGAASLRGEQLAAFSEMLHREAAAPKFAALLAPLEAAKASLSPEQAVVVREARKEYDRITKLPSSFSARKAKAQSDGFHAWAKARKEDDFATFLPHLKLHLELAREEAAILGSDNAYDYWIDRFDPGMTRPVIARLFAELEPQLKAIVATITAAPAQPDASIFKGFPIDAQHRFLQDVVQRMGFDFEHGRIDVAVHPFCGGHPLDTRMTTRFAEDNPLDSLSSAMHETGHALYEQGLPDAYAGSALGSAIGMAVHESQSRLWENQVGRSRAFWAFFEPRYREAFPTQLAKVSSEALYRAINRVAITPIRVDADEVTYNLHIMLRFEMEQGLFSGDIAPESLPDAWRAASERLLGYTPKSNAEGCLQDVHWSEGMFGYFPSYALGNLLAAQLWQTIRTAIPDLDSQIANADFAPLLAWLRTNVHSLGRRFDTRTFAREVTNGELSCNPLVEYLKSRYLPLYE